MCIDKSSYRKDGFYRVKFNNEYIIAKWCTNQDIDSSWCSWVIKGIDPPQGSWGFTDKDFEDIDETIIDTTQTI